MNLSQVGEHQLTGLPSIAVVVFCLFWAALPSYAQIDDPAIDDTLFFADTLQYIDEDRVDDGLSFTALGLADQYTTQKIHPYFRDEFRVWDDLRSLVNFAEPKSLGGYESIEDMVDLARELSHERQLNLVYAAIAGGTASLLAGEVNSYLRKKRVRGTRWDVDRVRTRFRMGRSLYASFYGTMAYQRSFLHVRPLKLDYIYYYSSNRQMHILTRWMVPQFGLRYIIANDYKLYAAIIKPDRRFQIDLQYRPDRQLAITSIRIYHAYRSYFRVNLVEYLQDSGPRYLQLQSRLRIRRTEKLFLALSYLTYLDSDRAGRLQSQLLVNW